MKTKKGFTLLMAIVITSMLLLVSFVVVNISLKQLILVYSGQESQYSFYNADSGLECAMYWDLKSSPSAFATSTTGTINCNGQSITTNSQLMNTLPIQQYSNIGGNSSPSMFQINFTHGCALVTVTKQANSQTLIESRGYNTCNTASDRRFERGIKISY